MTQQFRISFSGQITIDFGSLPVSESLFTIINPNVQPTSQVTGKIAYQAPTGKDLDELEMDAIDLKFGSGNGSILIYVKGMEGYLHDKFIINYLVG